MLDDVSRVGPLADISRPERHVQADVRFAHVKYDEHQELDLPEDRYRNRGYQPPFDQLPWKDEASDLGA